MLVDGSACSSKLRSGNTGADVSLLVGSSTAQKVEAMR